MKVFTKHPDKFPETVDGILEEFSEKPPEDYVSKLEGVVGNTAERVLRGTLEKLSSEEISGKHF